jgi:hypothetical protein
LCQLIAQKGRIQENNQQEQESLSSLSSEEEVIPALVSNNDS